MCYVFTVYQGVSSLCVYVTCVRDVCFITMQACSRQYVKWVARQLALFCLHQVRARTLHLSLQCQIPPILVHDLKPCHHFFSDACIPPSTHNHGEESTMQVSCSVNCNTCFSPPVFTFMYPYYHLVVLQCIGYRRPRRRFPYVAQVPGNACCLGTICAIIPIGVLHAPGALQRRSQRLKALYHACML